MVFIKCASNRTQLCPLSARVGPAAGPHEQLQTGFIRRLTGAWEPPNPEIQSAGGFCGQNTNSQHDKASKTCKLLGGRAPVHAVLEEGRRQKTSETLSSITMYWTALGGDVRPQQNFGWVPDRSLRHKLKACHIRSKRVTHDQSVSHRPKQVQKPRS